MNSYLSKFIRPHYIDLKGYVSAGMQADKSQDKIFLNANENPYDLPGLEGFNRYPEPQPKALLQRYANLYDVSPEHIIMTRGADEGIVMLLRLFCEPHQDSVVVSSPTFGMYAIGARAVPADVIDVPLIEEAGAFALDVQGIIEAAQQDSTKLVFLCSPNNPTANAFPKEDMERIIRETEGHAVVIMDETYIEFTKQTSFAAKLTKYPHLIVLRTLSKSYSMAALRMGVLLSGDKAFIDLIRTKALDVYPLPAPCIAATMELFNPATLEQAKANIQTILKERERVLAAFEASAHVEHIYPTDANFFMARFTKPQDYMRLCAQKDIILRDFSQNEATQGCLRISIGLPEHNNLLIDILETL